MEELLETAEKKGMHLVDNENLCEPENVFLQHLVEPDRLVEIVDPEETPFASKYKARDLLEKVLNQMEANKTIATLEAKRDVVATLNRRIAIVRVRLGSIAWECEEPHNAQVDLDMAANYYFPGYVETINQLCPNQQTDEDVPEGIQPPELPRVDCNQAEDAMKCLNLLGILWSGREQVKRSILYLLAATSLYDHVRTQEGLTDSTANAMESLLTHNYFYLAQAYGNIGNMQTSSHYCKLTLVRQWSAGFSGAASALDWAKNCMGLADFYISLGEYTAAAEALQSAAFCVEDRVKPLVSEDSKEISERIDDFEKSINRRWIRLDLTIMKHAFERELEKNRVMSMVREGALSQEVAEGYLADSAAHQLPNETISVSFDGISLTPINFLHPSAIVTFDNAREVYLRCATRLEKAKAQHPMDGFVTDHVTLLQEHSRLYHYLAVFEKDEKRKLAMEQRRIDMLKDVIDTISRSSFEALHKQVSYELGETYATMYDVKFAKLLKKFPKTDDFHDRVLKPADVSKCNEYVAGALRSFFHFIDLYTSPDVFSRKGCEYKNMSLDQLAKVPLLTPSSTLLSPEEVKPYINAHFYCCRMLTKAIPVGDEEGPMRSRFLIAARNRYVWLEKEAIRLCKEKEQDLAKIFGEEHKICTEMIALLPSKIDRVSYLRETPILLG